MNKNYEAEGYLDFFLSDVCELNCEINDKNDALKVFDGEDLPGWFIKPIYHLMSGEDFFACVDEGCFIDYDGTLSEVFVDGYISNLGLKHKGIKQGEFLVEGEIWCELCKKHKIEVNWANK